MRYLFFTTIAAMLFAACNPAECVNTNPVFDQYSPDDKEYKEELARVVGLCHKDSIAAWVQAYTARRGREYMYVNMIGRSVCATAILDITGNDELEDFRRVKGKSYRGALLPHIRYHIEYTNNIPDFVLDKVGEIVD